MESDQLPQNICTICEEHALNSYSFRLKCEESERILQEAHRLKVEDEYSSSSDQPENELQNEYF